MKLAEALLLIRESQNREGQPFVCSLAAGFNALHLKSFLAAELSLMLPEQRIEIAEGLYGDLAGNIARQARADHDVLIAVVEWADLDSRLGVRSSARWRESECSDIVGTARRRASELRDALKAASARRRVVASLPTLPLPPFSFTPGCQAGELEFELRNIAASMIGNNGGISEIQWLSQQWLDLTSPFSSRLDVDSAVRTGFPYQLSHCSLMAAGIARLVQKPTPRKGLITDLDGTLWHGILGEDGVDGISWDLDHNSQMHAFYQRFLGALADEGVLVGVASKNDPQLVEEAFARDDLAVAPSSLFPIEANWGPKSQAIARILDAWNVGPDSVVFVDDSPLELAEVKAAYPEMECMQFPVKGGSAVYDLAVQLRDRFGKDKLVQEDLIRRESIRNSQRAVPYASDAAFANFLDDVQAEITCSFSKMPADPRALQLVNKTNQFNLNGKRYTDAAWQRLLENRETFLLVASYRDKFGPLGKIAVLAGRLTESKMVIDTWVMSCRAFSRRIEHRCMSELLARFQWDTVEFDYVRTDRNGPLREHLRDLLGEEPAPRSAASRENVEAYLAQVLIPVEVTFHG